MMNLEDTIKSNNALMQNLADKMETLSKDKKVELNPNKVNSDEIEMLKSELNKHYNNVSEAITKLVKSNQKTDEELSLKESNLKLDSVLKILTDFVNKDDTKVHVHKKEIILFGKDSSLTTKHFLIMLGIVILTISSLKYLPTFFDYYSEIKSERDTYKTFYQYHYLRFTKGNNNKAIDNMENQLKLIQQQDSSFMYDYNTMEQWLEKDIKIKQLKDELKEVEQ